MSNRPYLKYTCPTCAAKIGESCIAANGRRAHGPHATRARLVTTAPAPSSEDICAAPRPKAPESEDICAAPRPPFTEASAKLNDLAKTVVCPVCKADAGDLCAAAGNGEVLSQSIHKARVEPFLSAYKLGVEDGFFIDSYLTGYADGKFLRESKV